MRRRTFMTLLGGTAIAPVFTARAQKAMPVIGFLHSGSPDENVGRTAAFAKGLSEAGFVEGQNVAIEYRWADGHNDRLPALADDLIQQQVAVIATPGSTPAALVAKAATTTIPIVFATGADPVALGLVASINRPGGNVTGITSLNAELASKRLGLLREVAAHAARFFALVNPTNTGMAEPFIKDLDAGAASNGIAVDVLRAGTDAEIEAAFASLPQQPGSALLVSTDAFFYIRRPQIAALSAQHGLLTIFDNRDYAKAGGLMSYGTDFLNVVQLAGTYTGRILKGEKPADLPVVQSAKFELVINLKTAKALGAAIPPQLLAIADEVIE